MATLTDLASCAPGASGAILPVSPYLGLFYHFGMLLGVDDFETVQAYHRGKMRLHNAWLHGEGVVWGFDVQADVAKGQVTVKPGLAVDAAGRELHLDGAACLNLAAWFAAHKDEHDLRQSMHDYDSSIDVPSDGSGGTPAALPDTVTFDAYVVVRFKGCLTRPVPAVASTCAGSETETAYSRVAETVEILLLPGQPPSRRTQYHLLRVLFSLEDGEKEGSDYKPDDAIVVALRDSILALPEAQQPRAYLDAFRKVAAMDEVKMLPAEKDGASLLFPVDDDAQIVLAAIPRITMTKGAVVSTSPVDISVRPVLVPTTTIQELLNGPLGGSLDLGGPSVVSAELIYDAGTPALAIGAKVTFSAPIAAGSVSQPDNPKVFLVTYYDTKWNDAAAVAWTLTSGTEVTLSWTALADGWQRVRLIAVGTGPTPILGDTTLLPLGAQSGGSGGSSDIGQDFVRMFKPRA